MKKNNILMIKIQKPELDLMMNIFVMALENKNIIIFVLDFGVLEMKMVKPEVYL